MASTAFSIRAISTWISCSALPMVAGSVVSSSRATVSRLNRWWCFIRKRVSSTSALSTTRPLAFPLGRLKSSRPSTIRVQRSTSLSMISRYSSTAPRSARDASSSRPVIAATQALMVASGLLISCMTPGRQLPDRRELLALHDLALDPPGVGHVLADRDDVADLVAVQPHRDLGQPEGPRLSAQRDLELGLLNLAGLEDPVELGPQLAGRLAGQHLEYLPAHDLVAPAARGRRSRVAGSRSGCGSRGRRRRARAAGCR